MTRTPLPSRRPSVTVTTSWQGHKIDVTVGFYPDTGEPGEVFATMEADAPVKATLSDHCTTVSLAMQYGVPVAALGKSLGTVPTWLLIDGAMVLADSPASPAGPIIEAAVAETGQQPWWKL